MPERIPLPVVAGPTASGKTGLAVALAKALNGEVVSADSMQVYDGLRVGTARPTDEEMGGIPHHLLGFLPLAEKYSVARYMEDAAAAIAGILERERQPILCGGTGLYIQSLLENRRYAPGGGTDKLREALLVRAEREGGEALLRELEKGDPETAARLHPNDTGRIVRALELLYATGLTMSEQVRRSHPEPSPYAACLLVLDARDRQVLYDRINRRTDAMLQKGLLEEAELALRLSSGSTAVQAIGYKELAPYFEGVLALEEAVENLKRQTRRYAKRQLTWFRRMARLEAAHFLYIDDYPDAAALADTALTLLRRELF